MSELSTSHESEQNKQFWLQQASILRHRTEFPLCHSRVGLNTASREVTAVALPPSVTQRLCRITGNSGFLLYVALLSAVKIYLYKCTNRSVIGVWSPVLKSSGHTGGRNMIVSIASIQDELSFREVLLSVREALLRGYAHDAYPYDQVLRDLNPSYGQDARAVSNVAVSLDDIHISGFDPDVDLALSAVQMDDAVLIKLTYDSSVLQLNKVRRFANHLTNLLDASLNDTNVTIGALRMVSGRERQEIVNEWNDTSVVRRESATVHELFENQAADVPDAIALLSEELHVSYGEVNRRADQLAHHLVVLGAVAEVKVAILLERSPQLDYQLIGGAEGRSGVCVY